MHNHEQYLINLAMYGNARRIKRYERQHYSPVYWAWIRGQDQGERGKPYRNPYPAGRRHDEFKRGYNLADPMGDHHGRNL